MFVIYFFIGLLAFYVVIPRFKRNWGIKYTSPTLQLWLKFLWDFELTSTSRSSAWCVYMIHEMLFESKSDPNMDSHYSSVDVEFTYQCEI